MIGSQQQFGRGRPPGYTPPAGAMSHPGGKGTGTTIAAQPFAAPQSPQQNAQQSHLPIYGGGGTNYAQPQPAAAASATATPRVGTVTTGITAGALPQSQLDSASQTMLAPPAMGGLMNSMYGGANGDQFSHLFGQQAQGGNTDMLRAAAPQQAGLQLQQQMANANAGLQQGSLLGRLQQDNFNAQMAARAPMQSVMMSLLGGGLGGFGA